MKFDVYCGESRPDLLSSQKPSLENDFKDTVQKIKGIAL